VDPRLFAQYTDTKELVGIDESRDELGTDGWEWSTLVARQDSFSCRIWGLGKTTLAKAVYEKIRALFDCCAFVLVSRTLDIKKLFKGLFYDLGNIIIEETLDESWLINKLKEFLK
jgi:hypothetical protein